MKRIIQDITPYYLRIHMLIVLMVFPCMLSAKDENTDDVEYRNSIMTLNAKQAEMAALEAGYVLIEHEVDRGETWESIARCFGVTEELLKNLNSTFEECYAGSLLMVPVPQGKSEMKNNEEADGNSSILLLARMKTERKDYKNAVKEYNSAIKIRPSIEAYYERALVQYKRGKLKQAISDLKQVKSYSDYASLYPDTDEMISSFSDELAEKRAQRSDMWGQLIGMVVGTGLQIGGAYLQAKNAAGTQSSSNSSCFNNSSVNPSTESFSSTSYYSNYSEPIEEPSPPKKKQKCGICGGTGTIIDYVASFDNPNKYCEKCRREVVSGHYHKTCIRCNGHGEY